MTRWPGEDAFRNANLRHDPVTSRTCIPEFLCLESQHGMEVKAGILAVCGYLDSPHWFSVPDPQVRSVVRSENPVWSSDISAGLLRRVVQSTTSLRYVRSDIHLLVPAPTFLRCRSWPELPNSHIVRHIIDFVLPDPLALECGLGRIVSSCPL